MSTNIKCSPERFKMLADELELRWYDNGKSVYVEFDGGFWVGVAQVYYPSLKFPPNTIVIGFAADFDDWEKDVDEIVPLYCMPKFMEFIKKL